MVREHAHHGFRKAPSGVRCGTWFWCSRNVIPDKEGGKVLGERALGVGGVEGRKGKFSVVIAFTKPVETADRDATDDCAVWAINIGIIFLPLGCVRGWGRGSGKGGRCYRGGRVEANLDGKLTGRVDIKIRMDRGGVEGNMLSDVGMMKVSRRRCPLGARVEIRRGLTPDTLPLQVGETKIKRKG